MSDSTYTRFSLSADETALVFSLINQADLGKSILANTYGKISAGAIEEKLTTASHSLLARGYVSISEKNTVSLSSEIEPVLFPLVKFKNILQVTMNTNQENGPEIINIYLGQQKKFTALRIQMGVIYEFLHGNFDHLPALVAEWLKLPQTVRFRDELLKSGFKINMPVFADLGASTQKQGSEKLQKAGFTKPIADSLMQDVLAPQKRGSVLMTQMTSENYLKKSTSEGGAGFLYLAGKTSSWIFAFAKADDNTIAQLIPGGYSDAVQQISALLVA